MKEQQIDMEKSDDCKLKVYSKRNKRAPVFITDFSHGEVKHNKNALKFECFKKNTSDNNVGCDATRELVATNGRLNYAGSSGQSALKYFVGVKNKETGKMKLYDCVFFRMKPDLEKVIDSIDPVKPKSFREGINELTQQFGSKAKKRALNTLQRCTVDTSLDNSLTINDSILQSSDRSNIEDTHHQIDYLPPQDRNASVPREVFDINDLISVEEDVALNQEAQDLLILPAAQFNEKCSSFCKYVTTRLHNINASKAKLLLYFNYLIIFQQLKYSNFRKNDPAPNIPNPYKKNMLEKFTLSSSNNKGRVSRTCPSQMKDKLVAYILVLALFIDSFKIILDEVHMSLSNVGIPKLKTIAEVLGCYTGKNKVGEEVVSFAELRLPLNEVTPKFSKKLGSSRF